MGWLFFFWGGGPLKKKKTKEVKRTLKKCLGDEKGRNRSKAKQVSFFWNEKTFVEVISEFFGGFLLGSSPGTVDWARKGYQGRSGRSGFFGDSDLRGPKEKKPGLKNGETTSNAKSSKSYPQNISE